MKKILLILFAFIVLKPVMAQDISIGNQGALLYDCVSNAKLYDSGGNAGSYSSGESFILSICPNPALPAGTPVAFEFVSSNFGHPNDFLAFYDGAGTTAAADLIYSFSQTSSQSIGNTYRTSLTNLNGCITVQFVSDASSPGGDFDFNILCLPACKSVTANTPTSSIAVQAAEPTYIHSCLEDPITFTGSGTYDASQAGYTQSDATSTFFWDFGSAGYDTGMVVTPSFTAGIYPIKLTVQDAAGCFSYNEINLSVRQTLIPDIKFFPEDTTVCVGEQVDVSAYLITSAGENLFIGDTAAFDTLKVQTSVYIQDTAFLPDDSDGITGNGITTPAVFEFPIFGYQPGATLQDINDLFFVCIDIEHSYIGDLDIILECPNGQSVTLVDFNPPGNSLGSYFGEPADNGILGEIGIPYTYCWSPAANPSDSIAQGNTGLVILPNNAVDTSIQYYPTGNNWSDLLGCPLNGDWTIQVFDDWGGDDGYVFGAAIEFDGSFALNPDTFLVAYDNPIWSANTQILTALNNDSITVLPNLPFQDLSISFEDNLGCSWNADYDGITVSTVAVNNLFKDTTICSTDQLNVLSLPDNLPLASCSYTVEMLDDFGDGWNGNNILFYADGIFIDTFTIETGLQNTALISASDYEGQTLTFEFDDSGSFPFEVSFTILDPFGNIIASDGPGPNAGLFLTTISSCYPGYSFDWSSNNPSSIIGATNGYELTIAPTTNTAYYSYIQNQYGCEGFDTSTLVFDASNIPLLNLDELPVEFCCSGTELNVNVNSLVTGPAVSQVLVNGVVATNNSFVVTSEDFVSDTDSLTYTIQVLAQNGCSVTKTIAMNKNCINPSITVGDTIFVGDSQVFTSSATAYDSMTYAWSTTDESQGAITDASAQNAEFNGIYEAVYDAGLDLTVYINQNNNTVLECVESAELKSYIVDDVLDLRYPTAFTPNGDAINNVFRPIMSAYGEIVDFRIYNRWGDMVYDISKSDNKQGWDGKRNGKDQANDVYIYYIAVKNFNEIITKEGSVTLVR